MKSEFYTSGEKVNKIYNAHDFYKKFYKDEILEEFDRKTIINPSSSSWN